MNRSELTKKLSKMVNLSKPDAERFLTAFIEAVTTELLDGEKVVLSGFGTFEARRREPRMGRNPRTGDAVSIPGASYPAFRPGKTFKLKLAGSPKPGAHAAVPPKPKLTAKPGVAKGTTSPPPGTVLKAKKPLQPKSAPVINPEQTAE